MKSTAEKIKNIDNYAESIIIAIRHSVKTEDDYINETTTMIFEDGSKLLFDNTFKKHLIH